MDRRNLLRGFALAPLLAKPMAKAFLAMPERVQQFPMVQAIIRAGTITSITITSGGSRYTTDTIVRISDTETK